ncbi:MAG: twin-arginine translocation signal domain-containing protein [Planctomycetaceae bacterium]
MILVTNNRKNEPVSSISLSEFIITEHRHACRLQLDRRQFLKATSGGVAAMAVPAGLSQFANAANAEAPMIVDTHMHVWADDPKRYPFPHPYSADFKEPMHPGTVEMLIEDMDKYGCTHAVLVQVIFHGWDNTYIADCVKRYPDRLRAHGLIDPTDPKVLTSLSTG